VLQYVCHLVEYQLHLPVNMEFIYCVTARHYLVYRLFARDVEGQLYCCQFPTAPSHQQTAQQIATAQYVL